jgi:hypothetical protein
MLPRPRTTACVVVVLVVLGEVCGQLLWESVRGGYFLRRSEGKGRRKEVRTMCNETVPSFLCVLCFLLGRVRVPDRFLVRCMLVCVLLQRHLYLKMEKFTDQL